MLFYRGKWGIYNHMDYLGENGYDTKKDTRPFSGTYPVDFKKSWGKFDLIVVRSRLDGSQGPKK